MSTILFNSCRNPNETKEFETYPTPIKENLWTVYTKGWTLFKLWSPSANEVTLRLFKTGKDSNAFSTHTFLRTIDGILQKKVNGDLNGTYYTYQVKIGDSWLAETPGIYAQAVGVNGNRAMVLDLKTTDPKDWSTDKGPQIKFPNQAIIYELHIRDMTIHPQSGSSFPGKYLGLVEKNTFGPQTCATGIEHLKELGITHVQVLPAYDHYSIDETQLEKPQYNWGYDPKNYNVPEGSFATNPFKAEVRIREFKQMVQTFHDNGIGVIMDVAYNHTGRTEASHFNQEVPGYYYRHWKNGTYANGSDCGNETASERAMMQKFMIASVTYWAEEFHIDGFRFDLMGIHDIATMNKISDAVKSINPHSILYGEGWTANESPLPKPERGLKKHMVQLPHFAAFSDEIRDGIKGSVFEDVSTGFVSGASNMEESIKFGIIGAIEHPQVNYTKVNYSNSPWAKAPWQAINYVSCHDNHTLIDKLKISKPDTLLEQRIAMSKLANAIVLTSQGTPLLHAGVELLRTKNGEHNSYNLPDSINQINWNWKHQHHNVFEYYQNLISLRKAHPAFHMKNTRAVAKHLKFIDTRNGIIAYRIDGNANNDTWKSILVIYNALTEPIPFKIKGTWKISVLGNTFDMSGNNSLKRIIEVPDLSMCILFQL